MRESWEITERRGNVGSGKTESEFICTHKRKVLGPPSLCCNLK